MNVANNIISIFILILIIHSVISSSQNNNQEGEQNGTQSVKSFSMEVENKAIGSQNYNKVGKENGTQSVKSNSSKVHKKNKAESSKNNNEEGEEIGTESVESNPIKVYNKAGESSISKNSHRGPLNANAAAFEPSSKQIFASPKSSSNQNSTRKNSEALRESEKIINDKNTSTKIHKNNKFGESLKSEKSRNDILNPNAVVFTPSTNQGLLLPRTSSNRIASYYRPGLVSPGSASNHFATYSGLSNKNSVTSAIPFGQRMGPNERSYKPNRALLRSASQIVTPDVTSNYPYIVLPGQSSGLHVRVNQVQNPGQVIAPPLNPNLNEPVSPTDPDFGPSASYESTQPKIRPFLAEMSLISKKARVNDPRAPEFSYDPRLENFVIIMHDNLLPINPTKDEVKPMNRITVYDSSLNVIYEGYPWLARELVNKYHNGQEYLSIDQSLRKPKEEIRRDIETLIDGKLIVGFKSKAKYFNHFYNVPNFRRRDLLSLIKFCDMLQSTPFTGKEFSSHSWNLKDLVLHFLGDRALQLENNSFSSELARVTYMRDLYVLLRVKWETEVQFLKKQIFYYKYFNEADLGRIFSLYGPGLYYPGMHKDGYEFALKYAQSVVPSNLYGIYITASPTCKNKIESVALYKADSLKLLFLGYLETKSEKEPGKKYYALSVISRILARHMEQTRKHPSLVTGYNVLGMVRTLDQAKRVLSNVTVYDTKKMFYGKCITKIAYKYLHVDYRPKYLPDWKEQNLSAHDAFYQCDKLIPVELYAKISLQLFRLYGLHEHPRVVGEPVRGQQNEKMSGEKGFVKQ